MLLDGRWKYLDPSFGPFTVAVAARMSPTERATALPVMEAARILAQLSREAAENGGHQPVSDVLSLVSHGRPASRPWTTDDLTAGLLQALRSGRLMVVRGWDGVQSVPSPRRLVAPPPSRAAPPPKPAALPAEEKRESEDLEPSIRLVNIESATFVPGKETIDLTYGIDGPVEKAAKVRMVVRSTAPSADPVVVYRMRLAGPYGATGTVAWDGRTDTHGELITLKGSPYEVTFELTSISGKRSTSAAAKVKLVVHSVAIEVTDAGPLEVAPRDKPAVERLIEELKASGAPGDCEGRAIIDGPVFFERYRELDTTASADRYVDFVRQAMSIPFRAVVRLKSKTGKGRRSPAALRGTRILWDFSYETEAEFAASVRRRGGNEHQVRFLTKVFSHRRDETVPKGVAAYQSLGGRRALQTGGHWRAGPGWKLSDGKERTWAAFMECGEVPSEEIDSAVYFMPGRIAGDAHKVQAILDVDATLDTADEAAPGRLLASHRSNVIKLTNWRRIPIVANWFVGSLPDWEPTDLTTTAREFAPAGVLVELAPGVVRSNVGPRWKRTYRAYVEAVVREGKAFLCDALELDPMEYPVRFRPYADYVQQAAGSRQLGGILRRVTEFFGVFDESDYQRKCDAHAFQVIASVAATLPAPDRGLTFIRFPSEGAHNQCPENDGTAGVALFVPGLTTRHRALAFQFTFEASVATTVHEIGHSLFLNHAPGGSQPAEPNHPADHAREPNCVMSYHEAEPTAFCGLCLLKLAGARYWHFSPDGTYAPGRDMDA